MTSMLHRFDNGDPMHRRLQIAQLNQVVNSRALQTALAESYVGLPLRGRPVVSHVPARSASRIALSPNP
jgi:hypothetical protein